MENKHWCGHNFAPIHNSQDVWVSNRGCVALLNCQVISIFT